MPIHHLTHPPLLNTILTNRVSIHLYLHINIITPLKEPAPRLLHLFLDFGLVRRLIVLEIHGDLGHGVVVEVDRGVQEAGLLI